MKKQQIVCDRCKKIFDEIDIYTDNMRKLAMIKAEIKSEYTFFGMKERYRFVGLKNVDLCHKCNNELIKWFYGDEKQEVEDG